MLGGYATHADAGQACPLVRAECSLLLLVGDEDRNASYLVRVATETLGERTLQVHDVGKHIRQVDAVEVLRLLFTEGLVEGFLRLRDHVPVIHAIALVVVWIGQTLAWKCGRLHLPHSGDSAPDVPTLARTSRRRRHGRTRC